MGLFNGLHAICALYASSLIFDVFGRFAFSKLHPSYDRQWQLSTANQIKWMKLRKQSMSWRSKLLQMYVIYESPPPTVNIHYDIITEAQK